MEDLKFKPILKGSTSSGRDILIVKDKIVSWYIPKSKPNTLIIELDGGHKHDCKYNTAHESIEALNSITTIMEEYLLAKYKLLKQ